MFPIGSIEVCSTLTSELEMLGLIVAHRDMGSSMVKVSDTIDEGEIERAQKKC